MSAVTQTRPALTDAVIDALLRPNTVAIVGASDDPVRIGGRSISYMQKQGFKGKILPVNPNRDKVQGLRAYASVTDLPETPDVAIVAVPAPAALAAVTQLAERGVKAAIVFSAGFAEVDAQGAAQQAALVAAAHRHGMRLLGPNALGIMNLHSGFNGSFSSTVELWPPVPGHIGIASQSGAYGAHLVCAASAAGLGLSTVVLSGNEADLNLGDAVRLMVKDPDTHVIALYAEGIRDGQGLVTALEDARRARKPVVVMKVGRSELGKAAAQSHTASIAGDDAVIDAVLAELGVVRVDNTEQLLDIAKLATQGIFPEHNTLGVLTVSGGAGILVSDVAEQYDLPMPQLSQAAQQALRALVPFSSPRNPVDVTAQYVNDISLAGRFADTMIEDGDFASILGLFTYSGGTPSIAKQLAAELGAIKNKYPGRLFAMVLQGQPEQLAFYQKENFCIFDDPTRAAQAIAAMGRFGRAFSRPALQAPPTLAPVTLPAQSPSEAQAKRILVQAGIACAPEHACADLPAALEAAREIGFPVVMKIISPDIVHKSEIGGVLLGVNSEDEVSAGFATLLARAQNAMPAARLEGVLVAKQLSGGVECIMGIHRDPVFGPMAMFGLGGVFVEILKDVVFHRCPFGADVAEQMIRSIRGAPLLLGARGRPVADIAALAATLSRLSAFAVAAGDALRAIDLNPVLAMPQGQGAFAVDAVIQVA
ncbi:MAG: acetate--CoA ligase family protein [Burkholderiaceae bacterium]|nr:acetate--CoA ligase family protein [Burkholderiaceae bacterium]